MSHRFNDGYVRAESDGYAKFYKDGYNFLSTDGYSLSLKAAGSNGKVLININGSAVANVTTTGLRIGDSTIATEKLDILGNITATGGITTNSGGAKVFIGGRPSTPGAHGGIWFSVTPSDSNYNFLGTSSAVLFQAPTDMYFQISGSTKAYVTSSGVKIGAASAATEILDISGRLFIGNLTEPSTPTGGGILYVEAGSLKFKGSSGTVTILGPA